MQYNRDIEHKEIEFLRLVILGNELVLTYKEKNLDCHKQTICESMHEQKIDISSVMDDATKQVNDVMERMYNRKTDEFVLTEESSVAVLHTMVSAMMASRLTTNLDEANKSDHEDMEPF